MSDTTTIISGNGSSLKTQTFVRREDFLKERSKLQESYVTWIIIASLLFFAIGAMFLINTTVFADTRSTGSSVISRQLGHTLFWTNLIFTLITFIILFIIIFLFYAIKQPSII
jgi:hypothetical protein